MNIRVLIHNPNHITLCSRSLCFSTASSILRPTHSASSAGTSNCCLTTACKPRDTVKHQRSNCITSNRIPTCTLIINGDFVNCAPCICCKSSPSELDHLGRAQCLCVLTAGAWHVSGPCQTWSLSPALVSDIKIDFT